MKSPKRRDAPRTKAAILAAAQKTFAEHGYAQTGIRDIAALADVTSPMVLRYFGSKAGLFAAALVEAMSVGELFQGRREDFGEQLTRVLLDASIDIHPPSMIVLASAHAEAREIAANSIDEHVVGPLAKWLGPPDARARALQMIAVALGFVLCTRQLALLSPRKAADKKVVEWFAKTVQAIVDQK